jgi:phosphate transport system permease protein
MNSSLLQLGGFLSVFAVTIYGVFVLYRITPNFQTISIREKVLKVLLILGTILSIYITLAIVLSVIYESYLFFEQVGVLEFIFGTHWSPQNGSFGAIPLFVGTFLITFIAMIVAGPLGLYSAIYLSEYATRGARSYIKPVLEILAGIPTVVYGYFAALTIAPLIRDFGEMVGWEVASESALAAGSVMGIMIIPYVLSLSDDVINSVPQSLRDASYALGATKSETIKKVVIPAALPGIMGAMLLGISRAVGETMIVVMAAGMAANLTVNPLEAVTTVTVQIVAMLTGDQEFSSAKTLSAFALGLALFIVTLTLNIFALRIVKKYREIYD